MFKYLPAWSFVPAEISPWAHSAARSLERPPLSAAGPQDTLLLAQLVVGFGCRWAVSGPAGRCSGMVGRGLHRPPESFTVKTWLRVLWWLPHRHTRMPGWQQPVQKVLLSFLPILMNKDVSIDLPALQHRGEVAPSQRVAVWPHGHDWIAVRAWPGLAWLFLGTGCCLSPSRQTVPMCRSQTAHTTQAGLPLKKVPHGGHCGLDGALEGGGPVEFSQLLLISQQHREVCAQRGGVGLLCEVVSQL